MTRRLPVLLLILVAICATPARATFHTYQIDEIFSNPDGSVQFIVLHESLGFNGQDKLAGHTLTDTHAGVTSTYTFPTNLPGAATANTSVLIATQGFAALGLVTPDYVIPDGFLAIGGGTLNYALVDQLTYGPLPTDGTNALYRSGATAKNLATNFAGASGSVVLAGRALVPDGTSVLQTFSSYPESRWFAMTVEPGKTYVIEAADVNGDLTANAIGSLNVYGPDTVSAPAEANADCTAANGPRPPAVEVASDGIRCVVRTALPTAGMQQNKRALFVKVTRMDPATGGGSQFKIRAREATAYGRWIINGFDYHVEVENTTGDAMCVEVSRYPASGLAYAPGPGWSGAIGSFTMTVPAFGAVKQVIPNGSLVGTDGEGTLRVGACSSPVNLIPGALHVSTYAFDTVNNRYIYFFTATSNEGKTRSTW